MLVLGSGFAGRAVAHPHIFVQSRAELIFDDQGYLTHIRHHWRFDDLYTAYAVQGLDANQDGTFSPDELAELAAINIQGLEEFGYFTFGDNSKVEMDFNAPFDPSMKMYTVDFDNYWLISAEDLAAIAEDIAEGRGAPELGPVNLVELSFTLPLKERVKVEGPLTVDVYDPTYYIDYKWTKETEAVTLVNAPGACRLDLVHPPELDGLVAAQLATIGADQRDVPDELREYTEALVNQVIVTCESSEGVGVATADAGSSQGGASKAVLPAKNAEDAVSQLAQGGQPLGLSEVGAARTADADNAIVLDEPGIWTSAMATITRLQNEFYRELTSALRSFRSSPNAGWLLMLVSFAYGVFHAAGPGHGKAVISSYVLADEQTLKRGVMLSFASAFAQAVTAIVLIGGAGVVLSLTSTAITSTAHWFELGSYILVVLLGVYMVWQRVLRPMLGKKAGSTCGHSHHHDHDHSHDDGEVCSSCEHSHAPEPKMLKEGRLSLPRVWSIILAIGLRPCTGALIVLAFSLSQGMIWAGVASTLVMSLGTGITVAVLASLAVLSRDVALRIWGAESAAGTIIMRGFEIVGALTILLMGCLMLAAGLNGGMASNLY